MDTAKIGNPRNLEESPRAREMANVRRVRYGFYRVVTEPVETPKCSMCPSTHVVVKVNGVLFCDSCFARSR